MAVAPRKYSRLNADELERREVYRMITRGTRMARAKHLAASLLLAAGIVLVFAGLSTALGFTPAGMLASVAAIAGLLYAGGIWFGGPARADGPLVFDHQLALASGMPLLTQFPEPLRAGLRVGCLAALAGERTRFTLHGRAFHALPVTDVDGVVICGVLIEGIPATQFHVVQG